MAILGGGALLVVALLFKELKLISFDLDFAASIGYPTTALTIILTALIIVAVVIGLQAVGVILVVAILIAPAAAARQWTDNLSTMLVLAGLFGAVSGVIGAILSSQISRLPTGPTVVLVATTITLFSLMFAPRRGLVWGAVRRWQHRRQVQLSAVLREVAEATRLGTGPAVPVDALAASRESSPQALSRQLATLSRRGLVARSANGSAGWTLTQAGIEAAREAERRERIWKLSMARQMDLSVDAVHLDANELERVLPADVLAEIEAQMLAEDATAGNGAAVAGGRHDLVTSTQTPSERSQ
jgi:manganese/zinc/iron transport system permease protein